MDEWNLIHLEGEESTFGLIDFSSENDSLVLDDESLPQCHNLLSENWKDLQSIDLFDSLNDIKEAEAEAEAATVEGIDQIKQLPDVSDSSEPDRVRRKGNCNLRKSLAWDSAFFTSPGVLDAEELSGMIGGAEKSKNHVLPRIAEDVARSTDSISSLGSESLTADNFEAELCEDIKASTQKSSKKLVAPGYKEASKKTLTLPSGRKMGPAPQNQVKSKTAMKKPDVWLKATPKQNLRAQGPVRTTKQDSALSEVTKSIKVADSTTVTTKLPQITGNGRSISTSSVKKDSFGATHGIKNENDRSKTSSGANKGAQDTKVASSIVARRILPKSGLSSKSCSISLPTMKTGSARSSTDSSGSNPSDCIAKFPVAAARKKVGEKQLKPPSGSTLKTPTKSAANNRTATKSSNLSAYLKSSKISSGVSPASSISEWSSVSSTSSSTINGKFNNLRTSFDASSCQSLDNESLASDLDHPSDHTLEGCEHRGIDAHSQKTKVPSGRPGAHAHPAAAKPSGLRMPSPTIGFFDGVKSGNTPKGSAQPHRSVSASLSKAGVVCRPGKQVITKPKIGKRLNTEKTPQVIAPDVISHDSDDGPTESKGSIIDTDVIASSNSEHNKESLVIHRKDENVAKDGENETEAGKTDQKQRGILTEEQGEVYNA